jgi:hypothetical protein
MLPISSTGYGMYLPHKYHLNFILKFFISALINFLIEIRIKK